MRIKNFKSCQQRHWSLWLALRSCSDHQPFKWVGGVIKRWTGSNLKRLDLKRHCSNDWSEMLKMHSLFANLSGLLSVQWQLLYIVQKDRSSQHKQNINQEAGLWLIPLVHRQDITVLDLRTVPQIQRPPFYWNPLSKAKAYSAGAKGNRRQGFQKGLATSRSNPGLYSPF